MKTVVKSEVSLLKYVVQCPYTSNINIKASFTLVK